MGQLHGRDRFLGAPHAGRARSPANGSPADGARASSGRSRATRGSNSGKASGRSHSPG
jgi:hypothetical protein